ncbi:YegP family protein [Pseudarthrobacter sp. H2]|uniref:YegP family protein n=1 Tax=Pseudarthrobacter sp. H2 TaxID=3418415 RepID=UPI003CEBA8A2
MAGIFEITEAGEESYFFKLTAADGTVVAVSPLFNTIKGAAAGINAVRENAATGLVVDRSRSGSRPPTSTPTTRPRGFRGTSRLAAG